MRAAPFVRVRGVLAGEQRTLIASDVEELQAQHELAMPQGKNWA